MVTSIFLLKNLATPPRLVRLRPCAPVPIGTHPMHVYYHYITARLNFLVADYSTMELKS